MVADGARGPRSGFCRTGNTGLWENSCDSGVLAPLFNLRLRTRPSRYGLARTLKPYPCSPVGRLVDPSISMFCMCLSVFGSSPCHIYLLPRYLIMLQADTYLLSIPSISPFDTITRLRYLRSPDPDDCSVNEQCREPLAIRSTRLDVIKFKAPASSSPLALTTTMSRSAGYPDDTSMRKLLLFPVARRQQVHARI